MRLRSLEALFGSFKLVPMTKQMKDQRPVGAEIKARRLALKLSREALGAAAGGVSSSTVRRVEFATVHPHPSTIAALKQALDAADRAHNDTRERLADGARREEGFRDPAGTRE